MKLFKNKKGFTIVELVIVVAVIGVLTAVLVPTFVNLTNKANEASNQSFVKNLNTAMAMRENEEGKNKTMSEAVEDAKAIGFDVEKLTPVNGRDLVWDSVSNRFLLLEPNGDIWYGSEYKQATDNVQIWKIYDAMPTEQKFSIYAKSDWPTTAANGLTVGFDAGSAAKKITSVSYSGTKDVVLRTLNDQCLVTINNPDANVNFYGFAKAITVKEVAPSSLHIYGSVNELAVEKGHVEIEDTGIVFDIVQIGAASTGEGATITNKGYVADVSLSGNTTAAAKEKAAESAPTNVGGDYEISNLSRLESFRDSVNAGNEFEGLTVKLTDNITLKDGWTPIGEASRKPSSTATPAERAAGLHSGTAFRGTFNGNNKTISNLNNKGYEPNVARVGVDGDEKQYAYGFFGIVASDASIYNLTLDQVRIDTSEYLPAAGDSVGALIGYATGNVTVSGITVKGSVTGTDAVAGIVGRGYPFSDTTEDFVAASSKLSITNCVNEANVKALGKNAAGILGFGNTKAATIVLNGNSNTGTYESAAAEHKASIANVQREGSGTLTYNGENKAVGSYHFN